MTTVAELLGRAKQAIESVDASYRAAGDSMAAARQQGATLKEIAEAVGKSVPWVCALLKWYACGNWDKTPFGEQSKASRTRRTEQLQATEVEKQQFTTPSEQQETSDYTPVVQAPDGAATVEAPDSTTAVEAPAVTVRSPTMLEHPFGDGHWSPAFRSPGVTILVGGVKAAVLEVALKIAATVSAGAEWPDYRRAERRDVVWLSSRTGVARGLRAKCEAAGAYIQGVRFPDAAADALGLPIRNLSEDLRRLGRGLSGEHPAKCIIIDYFGDYMSVGKTEQPVRDFRPTFDALQESAVTLGATIVLVCQLSTRDEEAAAGAAHAIKAMKAINTVVFVQHDGKKSRGIVHSILQQHEHASESYPFQLRNKDSESTVVWDKPSPVTPAFDELPDAVPGVTEAPDLSPSGVAENDVAPPSATVVEPISTVRGADGRQRLDKSMELVSFAHASTGVVPVFRRHDPGAAKTMAPSRTEAD